MDPLRFDITLRSLVADRRTTVRGVVGGMLGLMLTGFIGSDDTAAKRNRGPSVQGKKKRKKKAACASSLTRCGTRCVSLSTDAENCGGCGFTCGQGQTCSGKTCVGGASCPSGWVRCNGACT
ncbi:MAG: hypothetical protein ACKOCK_05870, partial [Chloroflexota bacterium]